MISVALTPGEPPQRIEPSTGKSHRRSLFAAVGPVPGPTDTGMTSAGLDDALAPFGIALDDQLVHDLEPSVSIPDTLGEQFFVDASDESSTPN